MIPNEVRRGGLLVLVIGTAFGLWLYLGASWRTEDLGKVPDAALQSAAGPSSTGFEPPAPVREVDVVSPLPVDTGKRDVVVPAPPEDPMTWALRLESLPDQARVATALELAAAVQQPPPPLGLREHRSAENLRALEAMERDAKSNPSGAPLSPEDRQFAASVLVEYQEHEHQLQTTVHKTRGAAWMVGANSGQYVRQDVAPPSPSVLTAPLPEKIAMMREVSAARDKATQEISERLGQQWRDWRSLTVGAGTATYLVFVTRTQAPEYFAASEALHGLEGRRTSWLRDFFRTRQRVRPVDLPSR